MRHAGRLAFRRATVLRFSPRFNRARTDAALSLASTSSTTRCASTVFTARTASLAAGMAGGVTDNASTPIPSSSRAASSSAANSPHTDTDAWPAAPRQVALNQLQETGIERVADRRNGVVVAVGGQRVLGQVVGADGEEVDVAGEHRGLERGGRHLDHHAHLQARPDDPDRCG